MLECVGFGARKVAMRHDLLHAQLPDRNPWFDFVDPDVLGPAEDQVAVCPDNPAELVVQNALVDRPNLRQGPRVDRVSSC